MCAAPIAPRGSPLSTAIIGVADLRTSLAFYRDRIGMRVSFRERWQSPELQRYWHLPRGSGCEAALLEAGADPVGRILLLDFVATARRTVRSADIKRAIGLFNLNFYTRDIQADYEKFSALGHHFWTEPVKHDFSAAVGTPIEVVFEGPDGVPINLVELATRDPQTRIGQMRAYVERYGYTPQGYTPVVTSSHGVSDRARAVAFYQQILDMKVLIDEELSSPDSNRFLGLSSDARTRITFMQGNHMFGKVVLAEPQNYSCPDITADAVAPNIGYLCQSFVVDHLDTALRECRKLGADIYTDATTLDLPGIGSQHAALVRNPGSGALQELVEVSS